MQKTLLNLKKGLVEKYSARGSFYTDYPIIGLWQEAFTDNDYEKALVNFTRAPKELPVLLYLHFPYCPEICYYCQCYSIFSQDYTKTQDFLNLLFKEIDLLRNFFKKHSFVPKIKEIHLGGGSPSCIREKEFELLVKRLQSLVNFSELDEFTIEIDPRNFEKEKLQYYAQKGINRISFGIQDFDPQVQKAVNRIQPPELIESLLTPEIRKLFKSINFDIIYGLPLQTRESFKKTIDTVIKLSPDRIALCVLGYRPDIFKHQKMLNESQIPDVYEKTIVNIEAMQRLMSSGYLRIGIDHFAKPGDALGKAMLSKKMHRNSLGYTPGRCYDMIGLGPSSNSRITERYYAQNTYSLSEYGEKLKQNKFPVFRGYKLSDDDIIRRDLMHQILSYFSLDFRYLEKKYGINFKEYFKEEIGALDDLAKDGLIELSSGGITVTELGKLFLRNICIPFDVFLKRNQQYKHSREFAVEKTRSC